MEHDIKIRTPGYLRFLRERRVRFGLDFLGIASLCMLTIYLNNSERIRIDERVQTRIEASGSKQDTGGLRINGISIPYEGMEDPVLSLDDYVRDTGAYNVQFTRMPAYNIESVLFSFKKDDGVHTQEIDFSDASDAETRELTFGGEARLQDIRILYKDGEQQVINFKK